MKKFLLLTILTLTILLTACSNNNDYQPEPTGTIHLFGELHGFQSIVDKQLEIWYNFYCNYGMRHLFIESSYAAAQFLNMWMQADDDTILYELIDDQQGTFGASASSIFFFRTIKENFPETIFHGTDIAHQADTTSQRFLQYLRDNNLQDSPSYQTTLENIAQYRRFRETLNHDIRSYYKPQNFIREFDALINQDIMAIHGGAHVELDDDLTSLFGVPTMATTLLAYYGDRLIIHSLADYALLQEALHFDIITIADIDFEAGFYGSGFGHPTDEFWKLAENYEYFSSHFPEHRFISGGIPVFHLPMPIEHGQVLVVYRNGARTFHIYEDGMQMQGMPITQRFTPCGQFDPNCNC